ncbi:MAG TPA: phenylalanine--tRNA ligase subunit beta [Microbacteriaceae bacterium]|nr:phenylalanine--tRNA ligase subunit beta [Microbacteriaceae bacterium]
MRVPLSWLAEYVDLKPGTTPEEVHAALVSVGLEEETIHRFGVTGPVVVGEVLDFAEEPQKNGKVIRWCRVRVAPEGQKAADGGADVRGIVCGAHNFVAGDRVVVTLPGAILPGPFPISARTTYGHLSDGMMASARELGLGSDHSGIIRLGQLGVDEPVGADVIGPLGLDDCAVEINVTPDRGYAFSVRGVAREYSHATGATFRDPALLYPAPPPATGRRVSLADETPLRGRPGARVFTTRVVRGVDPERPTPAWMTARLVLAGIRPRSILVDITNYVMLETGQPLHAYDLDRLVGDITVRRAAAGEHLTTLDGAERSLDPEDLVIADDAGAVGLAGVMGGARTEIGPASRNVLVEAANFDPVSIARSARRHKLPSEASKRFERGVDPKVADTAGYRAVCLITRLAGGSEDGTGSFFDDTRPAEAIRLPDGYVSGLIGLDYTDDEIRGALTAIGCRVEGAPNGLAVTAPTWRPDLGAPCDLAEEVARIVGYDRIPSLLPVAPPGHGLTRTQRLYRAASDALAAAGLTEVLSYPFVTGRENALYGSPDDEAPRAVELANPIDSKAPLLRTSLLPGLIGIARRNLSRGFVDLALYESGLVFRPDGDMALGSRTLPPGGALPGAAVLERLNAGIPAQPRHLAALFLGDIVPAGPHQPYVPAGLADALDAARLIGRVIGARLEVVEGRHHALHPGRTAALLVVRGHTKTPVGYAGELLPSLAREADLPRVVAVLEIDLGLVARAAADHVVAGQVSGYPAATQDLSLQVDRRIPAGRVRASVVEGSGTLLEEAALVADYRGPAVPDDMKSLTFALRFRAPDRTLTAAEATKAKEAGAAVAARRDGASVRD